MRCGGGGAGGARDPKREDEGKDSWVRTGSREEAERRRVERASLNSEKDVRRFAGQALQLMEVERNEMGEFQVTRTHHEKVEVSSFRKSTKQVRRSGSGSGSMLRKEGERAGGWSERVE
eukprot:753866-Hanusia_phi.AAC.1